MKGRRHSLPVSPSMTVARHSKLASPSTCGWRLPTTRVSASTSTTTARKGTTSSCMKGLGTSMGRLGGGLQVMNTQYKLVKNGDHAKPLYSKELGHRWTSKERQSVLAHISLTVRTLRAAKVSTTIAMAPPVLVLRSCRSLDPWFLTPSAPSTPRLPPNTPPS